MYELPNILQYEIGLLISRLRGRLKTAPWFVCSPSFVESEQTAMQENPLHSVEDARIDGLYRLLKGRINLNSIIPTCIEVAGEIEQLSGLKGSEKLRLLQDVIRLAITDSQKPLTEKEQLLFLVDSVIPFAVQAAILASKSPIVKHIQAGCLSCWK